MQRINFRTYPSYAPIKLNFLNPIIMQAKQVPVYDMRLFSEKVKHFFIDELSGLLEEHPMLEFPHKQEFYMLFYIEEAYGEVVLDNHKIRIDGTKVIMIQPQNICSIDINNAAKGKVICFTEDFFSLRYNNNMLNRFSFLQQGTKPFIRLNNPQQRHLNTLMCLLSEEAKRPRKESRKVIRSYLNIILFEIERLYQPVGYPGALKPRNEKVVKFEELVENHFIKEKLPSAYADMLHITPNYLNKICKEETGHTAGDLIRKRIFVEAKRLLLFTNLSVNEIATQLGYENASYFNTFFKKYEGNTPEQYRQAQD